MPVEIERKFLVASEGWRTVAGVGVPIAQGYLSVSGPFAVRVRRMGEEGFLTMKSNESGVRRLEFEFRFPDADVVPQRVALRLIMFQTLRGCGQLLPLQIELGTFFGQFFAGLL